MAHQNGLRSVLVLDDEAILAMMLEDMLMDLGAETIHTFSDPALALPVAADAPLDCAVLDVMMRGEPRYEVAEVLRERYIPFVFSSGLSAGQVDPRFSDAIFLNKPFSDDDLRQALEKALATSERSFGGPSVDAGLTEPGRPLQKGFNGPRLDRFH